MDGQRYAVSNFIIRLTFVKLKNGDKQTSNKAITKIADELFLVEKDLFKNIFSNVANNEREQGFKQKPATEIIEQLKCKKYMSEFDALLKNDMDKLEQWYDLIKRKDSKIIIGEMNDLLKAEAKKNNKENMRDDVPHNLYQVIRMKGNNTEIAEKAKKLYTSFVDVIKSENDIKRLTALDYFENHRLKNRVFGAVVVGGFGFVTITISPRLFEKDDLRYLYPSDYIYNRIVSKLNFSAYRIVECNDEGGIVDIKNRYPRFSAEFKELFNPIVGCEKTKMENKSKEKNKIIPTKCINIAFIKTDKNKGKIKDEFEYAVNIEKNKDVNVFAFHSHSSREIVIVSDLSWNKPIESLLCSDKKDSLKPYFCYRLCGVSFDLFKETEEDGFDIHEIFRNTKPDTNNIKLFAQLSVKAGKQQIVTEKIKNMCKKHKIECDFMYPFSSHNLIVRPVKDIPWKTYIDLIEYLRDKDIADDVFDVVPRISLNYDAVPRISNNLLIPEDSSKNDTEEKSRVIEEKLRLYKNFKSIIRLYLEGDLIKDRLPLLRLASILDTVVMSESVELRSDDVRNIVDTLTELFVKLKNKDKDSKSMLRNIERVLDVACCYLEEAMLEAFSGTFISIRELEVQTRTDFTGGLGGISTIKEAIRAIPIQMMENSGLYSGIRKPPFLFLSRRGGDFFSYLWRIGFTLPTSSMMNIFQLSRLFHEVGHLIIDTSEAFKDLLIEDYRKKGRYITSKDIKETLCELMAFGLGFESSIFLFTEKKAMWIATTLLKWEETYESSFILDREILKYFFVILFKTQHKEFEKLSHEKMFVTALTEYDKFVKNGLYNVIKRLMDEKINRIENNGGEHVPLDKNILIKKCEGFEKRISINQNTICDKTCRLISYFQYNKQLYAHMVNWIDESVEYKSIELKCYQKETHLISNENSEYIKYIIDKTTVGKSEYFIDVRPDIRYIADRLDRGLINIEQVIEPNRIILALLWNHYEKTIEKIKKDIGSYEFNAGEKWSVARLKGLRSNITAIYEFMNYLDSYDENQTSNI